ncbi:MAG: hypothetical protein JST48_11845 [Bacteroidetes bacterium]|nr:hypothetical protein [Bacteroidota bacterium]
MNKDWKYILYLVVLAVLFLSMFLTKDKSYDWTVTLAHNDQNPYGSYVLNELWHSFLPDIKIEHRFKTFYELKDSLKQNETVFILAESFNPDQGDTEALLQHVNKGGVALVSANYILGKFADTLGLRTKDYFFEKIKNIVDRNDTATFRLANPKLDTSQLFYYKRGNTHNFIANADTSVKKIKGLNPTVICSNDQGQPVTLKISLGKGIIIINSSPMMFTNIYVLNHNNHQLISSHLSYLPKNKVYWSEYYQQGRMEAATPLRYILTTEPLRWAYYIGIASILIFFFFEAKRKQRIIPVVKPLANTSLEFVDTISNLYYENNDHKSIAAKRILFFYEMLRTRYNFSMAVTNANYETALAHKTGADTEVIHWLIKTIRSIMNKEKISEEELSELNNLLNLFWKK